MSLVIRPYAWGFSGNNTAKRRMTLQMGYCTLLLGHLPESEYVVRLGFGD